jgi:hypothetical protein
MTREQEARPRHFKHLRQKYFLPKVESAKSGWLQAVAAGLAFFILFIVAHWGLAEFLLSDLADNRFFAGGGQHWPFFLKINPPARVAFWESRQDELNFANVLIALGLAMFAARAGLWLGAWMTRVRR